MEQVLKGTIAKFFIPMGTLAGTPCWYINLLAGDSESAVDEHTILKTLVESKLKTVAVQGKLSDNSELMTLFQGIASKGYDIIFITPASEDISPLRRIQRLRLIIKAEPPNAKENLISNSMFALLTVNDEIEFNVDSMEKYVDAVNWLNSKPSIFPQVVLNTSKAKDRNEIFIKYIEDCEKFRFKSRIMAPLNLLNDAK